MLSENEKIQKTLKGIVSTDKKTGSIENTPDNATSLEEAKEVSAFTGFISGEKKAPSGIFESGTGEK